MADKASDDTQKAQQPRAEVLADSTLRIVDQTYVVGLVVEDDDGNKVVVDNRSEGVRVPADQVAAVHQAAFDAGVLIEEVST
jgi:sporulation protein YlmC with PRC-barrel domain